jgi:hypothetical protein
MQSKAFFQLWKSTLLEEVKKELARPKSDPEEAERSKSAEVRDVG